MKFAYIRSGEHGVSVRKACEILGVSRSGYYEFVRRAKSKARMAREALLPFIEDIFHADKRRYGSRRVTVKFAKAGIAANRKTVQRIMSGRGLVAYGARKAYRRGGGASSRGANVLNGGTFPFRHATGHGAATSPTSPPERAGFTLRPSLISSQGRSSAGRCRRE